jgi:hypothetical protein
VSAHRDLLPPVDPDDAVQSAVLTSLLAEHPAQLTKLDLYRERRDADDVEEQDAVDRAVEGLVAAGLVHRSGPFVVPSRAALKFEELSSL